MPNTVGEMYMNEPDVDSINLNYEDINETLSIHLENDGFQGLYNPNGHCKHGCEIYLIADECGEDVDITSCCPGIICEQSGKIIPAASGHENLNTVLTIINTK